MGEGDEPETKKAKVDEVADEPEKAAEAEAPAEKAEEPAEEAPAEPAKTGFEDYTLNVANSLVKEYEGELLGNLPSMPVAVLQGLGPVSEKIASSLKLDTVQDLADYKFYKMAKAIVTLEATEQAGKRPTDSKMNIDKAVDASFETKTLGEICDAPVSALEGITDDASELLGSLGAGTVRKLGEWKYGNWASAIVELAQYENTKSKAERKQEAMLKRLQ